MIRYALKPGDRRGIIGADLHGAVSLREAGEVAGGKRFFHFIHLVFKRDKLREPFLIQAGKGILGDGKHGEHGGAHLTDVFFCSSGKFDPLFEKYEKDRVNPLPDSFVVEFESVNGFEELKLYLDNEVENIDQVSSHLDIAKRVNQIKNIILVVSIVLTALLAIVSWFIIANTIKLTFKYREDEINIMKYIGATNFFIACPFVVEACVVALLSSGIAYAIQYFAYDYVCNIVAEQYPMIQTVPIESLRLILAAAFFGATFILCLFGTIFSTRHYSKV
jgi:cell division protein FtsX